jgi:hypothetical protein
MHTTRLRVPESVVHDLRSLSIEQPAVASEQALLCKVCTSADETAQSPQAGGLCQRLKDGKEIAFVLKLLVFIEIGLVPLDSACSCALYRAKMQVLTLRRALRSSCSLNRSLM